MSRGPGRVERAIRELFDAHPDEAFVTDELAEHCYPNAGPIERKHRVAVLRAGRNVVKADPDWAALWIEHQGGGWVFANRASLQSYTLACVISVNMNGHVYRSTPQLARIAQAEGDPRNVPLATREEWLATLDVHWIREGMIGPFGAMYQAVRRHCAKRDGKYSWIEDMRETDPQYFAYYQRIVSQMAAAMIPPELRAELSDSEPTDNPQGNTYPSVADRLRALMTQNDPDAVRAGLAEIADTLEARVHHEPP
jgi:hypothetical protein